MYLPVYLPFSLPTLLIHSYASVYLPTHPANKASVDPAATDAALDRFSKAVVNSQACFPQDGKDLIAAVKNK